ncbi:MAG: ABC transporter permease [Candidatus Aminicenantes bacterium]
MKAGRLVKESFKQLGKNKLRSFLMMIGIVIGVTALTLVVSAGLGAQKRIMERVQKFGLDSLMVFTGGGREMGRPAGEQPAVNLTLDDAEAIKLEVDGIKELAPFNRRGQTEIIFQDLNTTAALFGVTPEWAPVWDWTAREGDFISEEDMDRFARFAVIGETVREEFFAGRNPIGEYIQAGNVQFEIKGIMETKGTSPGGGDMDNRVYIPLTTYMRRVANVDYLAGIKVRLESHKDIGRVAADIESLLRERHRIAPGMPDDFTVRKPDEVKEMAESVAGTFNILLIVIAGISLIAGGVVVSNIMLMSISERKREIGLRKAVGAQRKHILFQFLLESTVVTLTGGAVGIVLGVLGSRIMLALTAMPVSVSWEIVAVGVFCSSLVGIIAGLQPARRASALPPTEALKS